MMDGGLIDRADRSRGSDSVRLHGSLSISRRSRSFSADTDWSNLFDHENRQAREDRWASLHDR